MAAGAGKTYRMLLDGQAGQEAGRDVVVGLLESVQVTTWTFGVLRVILLSVI